MSTDAQVHIVEYDPLWPRQFSIERDALLPVLGHWLTGPIEHIGSTAIEGLAAKPVIDMMAGVDSLDASRPAIVVLERDHQYCYAPYRTEVMHWFCKPAPAFRTHHLHLVPFESPLWTEQLAFRDYLRSHPDVAAEYARLKRQLAEAHRLDREAYTNAKTPFVKQVIAAALKE